MVFRFYKEKEPNLISDKTTKDHENFFPAPEQDLAEWGDLTPKERDELYKQSVCRKYYPGETVFCQGDKCRGIYFVKQGLIRVHKVSPEGDTVTLRLAKKGDTLGYRPFLSNQPHRAFAEVLKESIVCFYPAAQMKKLLLENSRFGFGFLEKQACELGEAEERFADAVTKDVRYRFLHLLLVLKKYYGRDLPDGSAELELPISRLVMASMIGIRVESLSRIIRRLTDEGLIKMSGHRALIKNVERVSGEILPKDYLP